MRSAFKFFGALLCSFVLTACGGGGSALSEADGGGSTPAGTNSVSLTISNSEIGADTPATLSAKVTNSASGPVRGALVTFTLDNTALGTFVPAIGTALTDDSGIATVTLATSNVAGSGIVTASIAAGASATVGFTMVGNGGGSNSGISVVLSLTDKDGNALPNGTISDATPGKLTAVLSQNGAPLSGKRITFSLTGEGVLSPDSRATDAQGQASIDLLPGTQVGSGSVTASYAVDGGETVTSQSVAFNTKGDGGDVGGSSYSLSLSLTDASGQALSKVSKAVPGVLKAALTRDGQAISGARITFALEGQGQLAQDSKVTDAAGIAQIALLAGEQMGSGSVIATYTNGTEQTKSTPISFDTQGDLNPIKAYQLDVAVVDSSNQELRNIAYATPGNAVATLLKDGNPAPYERIDFAIGGQGVINPSSGMALTDSNGQAKVTLLTGNDAGAGTLTASYTLDEQQISDEFNYQVAGDAPGGDGEDYDLNLVMMNAQTNLVTSEVDVANPAQLTATLTDGEGMPVAGKVISFSSTLGNFIPNLGTALTDNTGVATIKLTAGSVEGAGEITASYGNDFNTNIGFFTAGDEIDLVEASPVVSFELYDCSSAAGWDRALKNFEACTPTSNISNDRPGIIGARVLRAGSDQPLKQLLVNASTTIGAVSPQSGTAITNDDGKAIFDLYANGDVGAGEVSLKVKDAQSTKAFEIGRVDIKLELQSAIGSNVLPAGGSTVLEATVFNPDDTLAAGQPFALSFTSECAVAGKAVIDSPVVTNGGKGYATYRSTGCEGSDTITVSAISGASTVTASTTMTIDAVNVGSLQYLSASPIQMALKGSGGIDGAGARTETSVVKFKLLDETGEPAGTEKVCMELSTDVGGLILSPAPLAADFLDCPGFPKPGDAEYPADLSQPNKYAVAYTNASGEVTATVTAGSVPTPVKVFAAWNGSQVDGRVIANVSDQLVVSTGLADQGSFSVSASQFNPEGWNFDGETVDITVMAADHFNNLVPAGTRIAFRTEGGAVGSSCETGGSVDKPDGTCSVEWRSQDDRPFASTPVVCPNNGYNGDLTPPCTGTSWAGFMDNSNSQLPEPRPGRATVTAYAIGEESFVDLNGNGLFDSNEPYTDISEAFTDHNEDGHYRKTAPVGTTDLSVEPAGAANEEFIDFNGNNAFDKADGKYTGLLCSAAAMLAGDCTNTGMDTMGAQLNVFRNLTIVMSGSVPQLRLLRLAADNDTLLPVSEIDLVDRTDPSNPVVKTQAEVVRLFVSDVNNNTLPYGTSITATTDNGKLVYGEKYEVLSNTSSRPLVYAFAVGQEDQPNQKTSGNLTITVKTPKGSPVHIVVPVKDNG
ncbi:invasin [Shewanella sp. YIC-542]|uniref:invasin n=1 Tax=Shewanella mytili TaxID=3377111 RepID=UPI00398E4FD7